MGRAGRTAVRRGSRLPPLRRRQPARRERRPDAAPGELGELHKSGVLTDEEFAVAKAKILNA